MTKFIVALKTGGVMEDPVVSYKDFLVVVADSKLEAEKKYNEHKNCSYCYGKALCTVDEYKTEIALAPVLSKLMPFDLYKLKQIR